MKDKPPKLINRVFIEIVITNLMDGAKNDFEDTFEEVAVVAAFDFGNSKLQKVLVEMVFR